VTDLATVLLTRRGALRHRLGLMGPVEALRARGDHEVADNAAEVATLSEVFASREHALDELRRVEVALAKIERGEYGRCEECGAAIGKARLKALPEAEFCIACAWRGEYERLRDERLRLPSPPAPAPDDEDEA